MNLNIPEELRSLPRWVVWRHSPPNGKVPYQLNGRKADKTNPEHWTTYAEATAAKGFDGVGFVFAGDGIVGIDLDHCIVDGELLPWAAEIVRDFDTYTEISPSEAGLHLFMFGSWPDPCGQGGRRRSHLEVYWDRAYFTVTGQCWLGTPESLQQRQPQIDALFQRQFVKLERPQAAPPPPINHTMSVDELLKVAFRSYNGARIRQLFDEPGAQGNSEGDAALCGLLAFYCRGDATLLDCMMRRSNRVRAKWDSMRGPETWLQRECRLAVEKHQGEWYTPQFKTAKSSTTVQPRSSSFESKGADRKINTFRCTDAGNAELFAHLYGSRTRFDHRRGRWLLFEGHYWKEDTVNEIMLMAKEAARRRYASASRLDDNEGRKWACSSESAAKLDACIKLAKAEPPIACTGDVWDADPMILGVPNGLVDLRTGNLRSGMPSDYVTKIAGVSYDAAARCPRWQQFLLEVFSGDEELIDFVWRSIGYSLTSMMTEQVFYLLYGQGSNGKSLFLDVLRVLLGQYATNASFHTFEAKGQQGNVACELVPLDGARLITASEAAEAGRLDEARVKSWTGQDPVTARALYAMPFIFLPVGKLWLASNHLPVVRDDSHGFWRRAMLIPFLQTFDPQAEPDLRDKLMDELPGIMAWAVGGAGIWAAEGAKRPTAVLAASQQWREESDPLADWMATCCETGGDDLQTSCAALYSSYLGFCGEAGIPERQRLTQRGFGNKLGRRFEQVRIRRGGKQVRCYLRISVKPEPASV